jgi:high-affinity K+ transport system ATPase subunit B
MAKKQSFWNPDILRQAIIDSFTKLDPRLMMKNPVMFVVEVGSVVTSALLIDEAVRHQPIGFNLQITLWLWFTVLFANFAEAIAEGRGKAQADTLRKAKGETMAYRFRPDGSLEAISSSALRSDDIIKVEAGQFIPATAKSSKASPPSTSLPSPANPRPSSAKPAAIAPLSPVAPASSLTGSRSASPPTPAKPSSTA